MEELYFQPPYPYYSGLDLNEKFHDTECDEETSRFGPPITDILEKRIFKENLTLIYKLT